MYSSGGKKKRNRTAYEEDNRLPEDDQTQESTRLSSGIVKKRVDDNFSDTSKRDLLDLKMVSELIVLFCSTSVTRI